MGLRWFLVGGRVPGASGKAVQEVLGLGDAITSETAFPVADHPGGGPGGVDVDDGLQVADEDGAFGGAIAEAGRLRPPGRRRGRPGVPVGVTRMVGCGLRSGGWSGVAVV